MHSLLSADMDAREEELKCPVCVETFSDPVRLPCGHNFCQTCIQVVWNMDDPKTSREGPLFCPECLQRKVQDREALRGHSLIEVTEDLISFKCKEHGEELKLFCQEDQIAVCCLCIGVGSHKNHQAVTLIPQHQSSSQVELPLKSVIEQEYSTPDKMKTVEQLVDNLDEVVLQNTQRLWSSKYGVSILGPETAHPELEVSADRLEVYWSKKPTPERKQKTNINSQYSVRAKERFSSGFHYWEVAVWKKPYWLIGLSYGSANGDQDSEHCNGDFNNAFCYVYHGNGKYLICQDSNEKPLAVRKTIQKLGVWVDIQKGNVSFYDGDTLALLHSFCVEFSGPVYPIFNPCFDINGQNSQPLAIVNLRNKNISQNKYRI
uniref:Uncharacterized protein n=1 Tax=Sinocyclocheilus rhinocerous TaxID=307959 RepID=A0A673GIM7_9TELE